MNSDLSLSLVSEVCVCEHQLKQRIKYINGTISVLAYNDDVFFVGGDIWWQKNIVLNELSMEAMDWKINSDFFLAIPRLCLKILKIKSTCHSLFSLLLRIMSL